MDGLAQPLPHSGLEAGGGYGPMRNLVPAGGGHLVRHWHSCLSGSLSPGRPLPALGYQQRLGSYNPYCHFIVASSQPLPALILMLAPPRHPPLQRILWLRASGGDCGQAALPYYVPSFPFVLGQAWGVCPLSVLQGQAPWSSYHKEMVNQVQLCPKLRRALRNASFMGLLGLAPLPDSLLLLGSLCDSQGPPPAFHL